MTSETRRNKDLHFLKANDIPPNSTISSWFSVLNSFIFPAWWLYMYKIFILFAHSWIWSQSLNIIVCFVTHDHTVREDLKIIINPSKLKIQLGQVNEELWKCVDGHDAINYSHWKNKMRRGNVFIRLTKKCINGYFCSWKAIVQRRARLIL